jgi:hypothetical protein
LRERPIKNLTELRHSSRIELDTLAHLARELAPVRSIGLKNQVARPSLLKHCVSAIDLSWMEAYSAPSKLMKSLYTCHVGTLPRWLAAVRHENRVHHLSGPRVVPLAVALPLEAELLVQLDRGLIPREDV